MFNNSFIVGRFQHFHKGHGRLVDAALTSSERVLLLIGSSQESHTQRNPFTAEFRKHIIETIYKPFIEKGMLKVEFLPDTTHEDDITYEWGEYVLSQVRSHLFEIPELMVYGNDEARDGWFDPNDKEAQRVSRLAVARGGFPISATELRGFLLMNNAWEWGKYVHEPIRPLFHEIREELLKVPFYSGKGAPLNEEK